MAVTVTGQTGADCAKDYGKLIQFAFVSLCTIHVIVSLFVFQVCFF